MNAHAPIVNTIAPIRNVSLMSALLERVLDRGVNLPGMGVFYGYSGLGKTTAGAFGANKHRAYVIEVRSTWTGKHLCKKIASEMGLETTGTISDISERVAQQLNLSRRPLIVDEADYLVQRNMIEIIRDIYEMSQGAVILIGEERLPAKLQRWERVAGRVQSYVAAEPMSEDDARHLARLYCRNVEIEGALFEKALKASGISARRMAVNLDRIRELADTRGLSRVTAQDWGKDAFYTGKAPAARRLS